jgi:2-isopropylmalate synthase
VSPSVRILDSTLREGEQTPGVCFDAHIRAAVADLLDAVGIDIVEVGHPAVTAQIRSSVAEISSRGLRALVGAHARSLEADVDLALECDVSFLGIFYCVSESRLRHHNHHLGGAVDRIASIIDYVKRRRPELVVRYTPEDTVRSAWQNVVTAAVSAADAGADIISIADTTGHMIPGTDRSMYDYVLRLRDALAFRGLEPEIAVHCHNDRGLALANTLDGYRAGATVLDSTVLGLGERAGITDLATLLVVLTSDFEAAERWDLTRLPELYQLVSRYSGVPIPVHHPVTGRNAFTHCAGVHTQAAIADPLHYQSLDPELVGRRSRIALDHMSGLSAVRHSLEAIGEHSVDDVTLPRILHHIKEIGQTGRIVDADELRLIVSYMSRHPETRTPVEAVGR